MTRYVKLASKNTSQYQISDESVKGFGSYANLKFRPKRPLKYRL